MHSSYVCRFPSSRHSATFWPICSRTCKKKERANEFRSKYGCPYVWVYYINIHHIYTNCPPRATPRTSRESVRERGSEGARILAFTRYYHHQWCMVYGIKGRLGRGGAYIAQWSCNNVVTG